MTWNKKNDPKNPRDVVQNTTNSSIDGGWAWVVTFACCIGIMLSMALWNTLGIFYTRMKDDLNFEMTSLTIIGSTHSALVLSGAVVVVPIVEKFGERPVIIMGGFLQFIGCFATGWMTSFPLMFVFMGVITGIGSASIFVTCLMAVDKYFDKKKSIAIPLASIGGSLSMTIFTPVTETILDTFGFAGGMMVYSAIMLNIVVCGTVVFPIKQKDSKQPNKPGEKVDMSFCRRPSFIAYMITNILFVAGSMIPIGLLPETASSVGVDVEDISITFSLSGALQILGRVLFSLISYRIPSRITFLWVIFLVAMGLTMLIVPFSTNMYHFMIFNIFGGFFIGGVNLGFNLSLKNLIDIRYYGRGLSLALLMQGIGGLLGNPIAALLLEATGDGGVPYYFGALLFIIAGGLLIPFSKAIREHKQEIIIKVTKDKVKASSRRVSKASIMIEDPDYDREAEFHDYSNI